MIGEFSSEIWNGVFSFSFLAALLGHEFEQTPGDREGQGSLVCSQFTGWQRVIHDLATQQQFLGLWHLSSLARDGKWTQWSLTVKQRSYSLSVRVCVQHPFWGSS